MSAKFTAGRFEARVWAGGYPICVDVSAKHYSGSSEISLSHGELADLLHVLTRAMREARAKLPDRDKHEVPEV